MDEPADLGPRLELAYKDDEFLERSEARPIRILAEYLSPLSSFRREKIRDTVVFFGSARIMEMGIMGRYYRDARQLARLVTAWSNGLSNPARRFVICSGGGPGIMEAANRGAQDAGGKTIGLNIGLPFEQRPNPFITPELNFEFHYFFMRKFWFAYLAKALVVFPGGFGTLDELSEILTLVQTRKLEKPMGILLYGTEFWKEVINFDALIKYGMISAEDMSLFEFSDDPADAFEKLRHGLTLHYLQPSDRHAIPPGEGPDIAKTVR